jgi:hypothetical protein
MTPTTACAFSCVCSSIVATCVGCCANGMALALLCTPTHFLVILRRALCYPVSSSNMVGRLCAVRRACVGLLPQLGPHLCCPVLAFPARLRFLKVKPPLTRTNDINMVACSVIASLVAGGLVCTFVVDRGLYTGCPLLGQPREQCAL